MNLKEALDAVWNLYWSGSNNEEEVVRIGRLWQGELGRRRPLEEITVREILDIVRDWDVSRSTLNRRLSVLSRVLRYAEAAGAIEKAPAVPRFKEPPAKDRSLSEEQVERLMREAHECGFLSLQATIGVLVNTGARLGELLARPWNISGDVWHIPDSKTGEPRTVPLNTAAVTWFCVFLGSKTPSRDTLQHQWRKVRALAGVPHARLHDLRHTFASRLARKGVSLYTIGALLGHKDPRTTMRYAHLDTKALEEAVRL